MSSREKQKEQRRDEILDAALDLFVRKGYAGTTIKDIASAVDMSVGLLFHYFASKEALLLELVKLGNFGPQNTLSSIDEEHVFESLASAVSYIFNAIEQYPFVAKLFVLMTQIYRSESTPASVRELINYNTTYLETVALIELGQKQGTIRDGDSLSLSVAFWSSIQGMAEAVALMPELPMGDPEWFMDILRRPKTGDAK